ncbi:MAG: twin-arginine translocation signal domain-containing protein [Betaproteobacteria bacterium]|nr:MAG: twin-arginine translocation signal domain-containing protein [Betaproteobacteria bacterium]TMH77308.1 MAG: twin-arginine translocation signal domain-containing protein [Betaproteobacteria bacterium]
MSDHSRDLSGAGRRNFLKGVTLTGAAALTPAVVAQTPPPKNPARVVPLPNLAVETLPPPADPSNQTSSGGDFMVDVLKTLDIDYLAMNCASSFRGLHEAVINYAKNVKPEILTCTHEEIAVAMGQGYAKIEGKPMAMICHGTVGLQHASMAMYNAWCDRVPVYVMIGNIIEADKRAPGVEWVHSAIDPAALVRDFVKWDDQPASLQHFAESAVRAYKVAMTPPMGPVLLSLDAELQENPIPDRERLRIPKFAKVTPPVGDPGALAEAAKMLAAAQNPVLICDRLARTPAGMARLVELAETLQCAVVDQGGRMNFPSRHPLNQTFRRAAVVGEADVILAIEMNDLYGAVNSFSDRIVRATRAIFKPDAKIITLGSRDLYLKSNYQDFGRYAEADLAIAGDGEASLPALTEQIKRLVNAGRKSAFEARGKKLAEAHLATRERAKSDATIGWDASPITTARMCAEIYSQIKDEDWSLVGNGINIAWPRRLWNMDKPYRWNGVSGGAGIGYNAPASAGAALANKRHGRLSVTIQGDGDLMFAPGTLWTAAHHHIPILYVLLNNRAYHQELMYMQAMAARHGRSVENSHIGITITDPNIDYATVAKGFGVYAEGPITDPKNLGPALKRAVAVVKRGEPALVDVVTDPR